MSLSSILNTATSGLQANQTALRTTSNNISNVNTEGYHRRVVQFGPQLTAGSLNGVTINEIQRIADDFLAREATTASGALGRADILTTYFERAQNLIGSLDGQSSLDARIASAMSALTQLSVDPSSPARRNAALTAVTSALNSISAMATNVQALRKDANTQLMTDIPIVNGIIARIYDLNSKIKTSTSSGEASSGLLDQRDIAIGELSKYLDIRASEQGDGRVYVSLADGTNLVSDISSELHYSGSVAVVPSTSFPPLTLQRINPETGADIGPALALEGRIGGGELRGLLDMRDKVLPDLAEQMGALAGSLSEQLNAVHNNSSAVPPPATLTGRNTGLDGTDALNFTGNATIAIVDAQGALQQRLDIDFSTLGSVDDLVTTINGWLAGSATANFTNGVLSINATVAGTGVAILQDPATPSSRGGRGMAQFFGLNDLVGGASPSSFATGVATGDAHGFNAGGVTSFVLRGANGGIIRNFSLTVGGASNSDIVSDLNAAAGGTAVFALDANGNMTVTPSAANAGARLEVTTDSTSRGATGVSLSLFFGLGTAMRQNQAMALAVRSDIATNSSKMALAQLDLSPATVAGDTVLGISDNRGAIGLAAIAQTAVTFAGAGGLAGGSMSISDYTGLVLSRQADLMNSAIADRSFRQGVVEDAVARRTTLEGVNLDEELSNMMIYQQAYNASARLLTTVQEMYDTLLRVV